MNQQIIPPGRVCWDLGEAVQTELVGGGRRAVCMDRKDKVGHVHSVLPVVFFAWSCVGDRLQSEAI